MAMYRVIYHSDFKTGSLETHEILQLNTRMVKDNENLEFISRVRRGEGPQAASSSEWAGWTLELLAQQPLMHKALGKGARSHQAGQQALALCCASPVCDTLHKALQRQGQGPGTQWWLSGSV